MRRFVLFLLLCAKAFSVDTFLFPLPQKYANMITSLQGLRNEIPGEDTGGNPAYAGYHNAIDVSCPEGTPVYAAKSGTVTDVWPSFYNGGAVYKGHPTYGGLVAIAHTDGTMSMYAHLSLTLVKEGEFVAAGQKIGKSGGIRGKRGSGTSTGAHLHFAVFLDIKGFTEFPSEEQ